MVVADIDQVMIASCIGITHPTLRKHYRAELDKSYAIIKSDIVAKFVTKARGGDLKAMIFYLETHGWVKSERLVVDDVDSTSSLSDAEIEARLAKLQRRSRPQK